MANSLGNGLLNAKYWVATMQEYRDKNLVAKAICNYAGKGLLKNGDTENRPYSSDIISQSYTKGTAFTVQDITATNDTLTVNTVKVAPFYLDSVDKVQNSYDTAKEFAEKAMQVLNELIDGEVLGEYANATSTVKTGDIDGTSSTVAIAPSTGNINKIFTAAGKKLNQLSVQNDKRFAVISPTILEILQQYTAGKDTAIGDKVMENGFIGDRFGFSLYLSNNLTYTAKWTPANNPTESDTVTINGVAFTFNATPSGAGSINIGGNTAGSLDNLVACINGTGTAGTDYIALSNASKKLLAGCTATDGATYMTIKFKGAGEIVLAALEAADLWSVEIEHLLMGRKGATRLIEQKTPNMEIKEVPDKLGKNYVPWTLFGLKTWNNNEDLLVDVHIDGTKLK